MIIYKLPECTPVPSLPEGAALALGNFDGVHRGHQRLFDTVNEMKRRGACTCSAAWTFTTLAKEDKNVTYITDMNAKMLNFANCGLDYAIFEDFSDVCDMECREFVTGRLLETLKAGGIVCGFNFKFGKGGAGDSTVLSTILNEAGIPCEIISPVMRDGVVVSSTKIRDYIENGNMDGAFDLLGRPFSVKFPVLHGKELGRTIGIPTINQSFPEGHIIPKKGIYACTCFVNGEIFLGVCNIGVRPSVDDGDEINCETHIINYTGDLYGKEIKLEFYQYMRDEMKFDSLDALRRQIKIDIAECLDYFCTMYGN